MITLIPILLLALSTTAQSAPAKTAPPRFNDIDFLQKGYNIYKGNPYQNSPIPDPGFTQNNIWDFSYNSKRTTADGRYSIPDGTSFLVSDGCVLDFESSTMSGETTFTKSLEQLVTAEAGYLEGSFTASVGYSSMSSEFNSYNYRYTTSTATCFVYQGNIDGRPKFSATFLSDAADLPLTYDAQAYQQFYDKYGTHYIGMMNMGSRLTYIDSFTENSWSKLESQGIDVSVAAKYSGLVSLGVTSSTKVNTTAASSYDSQITKRRTISLGSLPPGDGKLSTWLSSSKSNPAPIGLTLQDLSDLFTKSYFDATFPNYKNLATIKKNLQQASDSYCSYLQSTTKTKSLRPTCLPPNADKVFGLIGTLMSLVPYNAQTTYLRRRMNDTQLWFDPDDSTEEFKNEATWLLVAGLCGTPGTVSFQSLSNPVYYIRLDHLDQNTATSSGKKEMCYYPRDGWTDSSGYSFESVAKPGFFLDGSSNTLSLTNRTNSSSLDAAFTFLAADNALAAPVINNDYSIESVTGPGAYLRNWFGQIYIWAYEDDDSYKLDSTYKAVPGLCGVNGSFSFESVHYPNSYIRHQNFVVRDDDYLDSDVFRHDACWYIRPPLSGNIGVSIQPVYFPDYYIKIPDSQAGVTSIEKNTGLTGFKQLTRFQFAPPLAS